MPDGNRTAFAHQRSAAIRALVTSLLILKLGLAGMGCDSGGSSENKEPEPTVPPAPTGLTARSDDAAVHLDWSGSSAAEAYNVYRATSTMSNVPDEPLAQISATSYTDDDVQNGTTYHYRVTAVADVDSDPSKEVIVTPFAAPPARP